MALEDHGDELACRPHILVVDDDIRICDLVSRYLIENGFIALVANSADQAKDVMERFLFDALIVDVMMPGQNGLDFTRELRECNNNLPVILLTALGEVDDRICGLESGADDYLPKPFEPRELVLRLNAVLRRLPPRKKKQVKYKIGRWLFDPKFDELTAIDEDGQEQDRGQYQDTVSLTALEANLLRAFCEKGGEVLSRAELSRCCSLDAGERTIDVQVTRLRRKIEEVPKTPKCLITVRGKGYLLRAEQMDTGKQ